MMTDSHKPDPEFVARLEWQVQTAARRRERFNRPVGRSPGRAVQLAALILVSVFCGAAGVMATDQIQDSKQKLLLIVQSENQLEVAALQLQVVRVRLEEIRKQYEAGLVTDEVLRAAEQNVREAETQIKQIRLNLEEIRISGQEPGNEITSPLVGDRDFVSERIKFAIELTRSHLSAAESRLARIQALREAGMARAPDEQEMQTALLEIRSQVDNLAQKLQLRERFLKGEIAEEDLKKEVQLAELQSQLKLLEQQMLVMRTRHAKVQELYEKELISRLEVLQQELRLKEIETQIRFLQMRIEYVQSGGEPPPD
jgi:hypothetical protein